MKKLHFIYVLVGIFLADISSATVYQAETADLYKAVIETKNGGYIGDAYVNFDNVPESYLDIRVGMAAEGEQNVTIRFANGTASSRPMEIKLNDIVISGSLNFNSTGSWTSWDTISVKMNFKEGVNILRLTSVGSEGGPNLDQFEITGEQAPTFKLNLSIEGNGQILQSPLNGLLFKGEEITLVAKPDYNSVFLNWSGDLTSVNDTLRFIMEDDKTIQANFVEIEIILPDPDFSMIVYATVPGEGIETTTGGFTGNTIVIETLQQLIDWGAAREDNYIPETVIIKGKIEAEITTVVNIKRGKDISILGDSETNGGFAELKNISLNIRDYSNVIIRNLKMHEVFYPDDDLTIDNCHHVWIDHCEFYSKIGPGINVDTYDGLLDIKKGSRNVTVSWCWFHDHMKTVLIGHSDNNGEQDIDLEVTMHHNRFSNTDGRNPSLRFGKIHYFNNYLENITDYGLAVRNGAHAKIENCHFESVNVPVATDKFEGHGYACISGSIYSGSCSEASNEMNAPFDCEFWNDMIPYSYALESTHTVKISVENYAGVGIINPVTSVSDFKVDESLLLNNLFFNRIDENINLSFSIDSSQKLTFSVYTIDGKIILNESRDYIAGKHFIQFPVHGIKRGIYLLKIDSEKGKVSKKILL